MNRSTYRLSLEGSDNVWFLASAGAPDTEAAQVPRETAFRPVEGGRETTSGELLLIEAYAALWIILLGFLLVSWRRQSRIDARVAELERSLAQPHGAK
jgi:hypothetical protein